LKSGGQDADFHELRFKLFYGQFSNFLLMIGFCRMQR
jgi:hypothetical protein